MLSIIAGSMTKRFKGDDVFIYYDTCTFIDSLSSCHPYHMHLVYGNEQLRNSRQLRINQCWCPSHEILTKLTENKHTPVLVRKINACTQYRD